MRLDTSSCGISFDEEETLQITAIAEGAIPSEADCLLDDAPEEPFNLNIYFDKAIGHGRLLGMMMEGHWLTVGTPDAIDDAEETIRRFRTFA